LSIDSVGAELTAEQIAEIEGSIPEINRDVPFLGREEFQIDDRRKQRYYKLWRFDV